VKIEINETSFFSPVACDRFFLHKPKTPVANDRAKKTDWSKIKKQGDKDERGLHLLSPCHLVHSALC